EAFLEKLRANEVFAMEMVPDMSTLERLRVYMNYPPGQRLETVIGSERFRVLEAALTAYPVPAASIERMRPWAALMTLSTPPPVTGFFMDLSLSLRASGSGLELVGLETIEEQLSFLQNMPMPMQLALLDQAIAGVGHVAEVHARMVNAYLQNNLEDLQTLTDEQLQATGQSASDYFTKSGIHARNHRMLDSLLRQLDHKTVFVAVGALHLPGEEGLINLLRQHGFSLSPLDMPFKGIQDKGIQDTHPTIPSP
ncbi:MAG: TraB/GumN family protein, partial [Lysobacterales bacterium]